MNVRKYSDGSAGYVIGHGIGCTKQTMTAKIVPEVWTDFPNLKKEQATMVVLLKGGCETGKETIVGVGLHFPLPEGTSVPVSYGPFPGNYCRRWEEPSGEESFKGYFSEESETAFYMGESVGCSWVGMEMLFHLQEKDFPDVDPTRIFIVLFSRGQVRGRVGLKLPADAKAVPSSFIRMSGIPRCVP